MNEFRSRPLKYPWPPLIYFMACIVGLSVEAFVPSPPGFHMTVAAPIAGWLFITLAVSLDIWALKTLHDRETAVMPNKCATHLVTCGPYRFTRNPTYLAYTLLTLGIGLVAGSAWCMLASLAAAAVTTYLAIRREEFHLLSRFGFEFERYCHATRRWL
jgi:protein-S-isoprenylcysteine O-methyltransferase Ste14